MERAVSGVVRELEGKAVPCPCLPWTLGPFLGACCRVCSRSMDVTHGSNSLSSLRSGGRRLAAWDPSVSRVVCPASEDMLGVCGAECLRCRERQDMRAREGVFCIIADAADALLSPQTPHTVLIACRNIVQCRIATSQAAARARSGLAYGRWWCHRQQTLQACLGEVIVSSAFLSLSCLMSRPKREAQTFGLRMVADTWPTDGRNNVI